MYRYFLPKQQEGVACTHVLQLNNAMLALCPDLGACNVHSPLPHVVSLLLTLQGNMTSNIHDKHKKAIDHLPAEINDHVRIYMLHTTGFSLSQFQRDLIDSGWHFCL